MAHGSPARPPEQRQPVLDDFLRGHISAGELSRQLADGREPGSSPGDTAAMPRPGRRHRRLWLIPALAPLAAVGGLLGSAIGAQIVPGGPLGAVRGAVGPAQHHHHRAPAVAVSPAQPVAQTSGSVSSTVAAQPSTQAGHTATTRSTTQTTTAPTRTAATTTQTSNTVTADAAPTSTAPTSTASTPTQTTTSAPAPTTTTTTTSSPPSSTPTTTGAAQSPSGSGGGSG